MELRYLLGCAVFLVLFVYPMAEGAEWVYVGTSADDTKLYVDTESIVQQPDGIVKAWVKYILSDKRRAKMKEFDYLQSETIRSLIEYNCTTRESRRLSATWYDSRGEVTHRDTEDKNWKSVVPDSTAEGVLNFVCSNKVEK